MLKDYLIIGIAVMLITVVTAIFRGPIPWWHPRGFLIVLIVAAVRFWR